MAGKRDYRPASGTEGFISYAHDDRDTLARFRKHLSAIERAFGISFWADERVAAGDYWRDEIAQAIKRARAHILLITPSFFDSDYIFDHELLMEIRHACPE